MSNQFMSPDGDLERIFVTDPAMIDQFADVGSYWTWGENGGGPLGDNTSLAKSSPIQTIAAGTNWQSISVYGCSARNLGAGIKTDGTLWVWGSNYYGQVGDNTRVDKSSPVQTISAGSNWSQVSASRTETGAIKTDGTLWMWGLNDNAQLGDNTIIKKSSPVQTIAGGTNWKQLSCNYQYTAAIKTDGTLWTWGNNVNGALGDGTTTNRSSPVQTVAGGTNWKQVSCGGMAGGGARCMGAVKTDGTLWMWGDNTVGGLGDGTVIKKSSPVQTIAGGTNWKQVSCGYSVAAIKTDGTLWGWGGNLSYGSIGDNTTVSKSSPVQTVAGGTNWKQVSNGYGTSAIKTDGTLWTWGYGSNGCLGDNTAIHKSSPVQTIAGGTNWKQVALMGGHNAAITFSATP